MLDSTEDDWTLRVTAGGCERVRERGLRFGYRDTPASNNILNFSPTQMSMQNDAADVPLQVTEFCE